MDHLLPWHAICYPTVSVNNFSMSLIHQQLTLNSLPVPQHHHERRTEMRKNRMIGLLVTMLLSLASVSALAANKAPLTPEMAAKREMVRKQQGQRITNEQRKAAAEALKAERLKIYNAKHGIQQSPPDTTNNK
jgi:hypothetical protein